MPTPTPSASSSLLAAATDHQHPDNARVLAVFRTLLAPEAMEEAFLVGREAGVPVLLSHHKVQPRAVESSRGRFSVSCMENH